MKEFWIKFSDKNRFIESVDGHYISEMCEPFFLLEMSGQFNMVVKYYRYRVDITDEEYLFLKLQFDLKDEV